MHERAERAERVELFPLVGTGTVTGHAHPGLEFRFYNYMNDELAHVEFCCSPSMLLGFVDAVMRMADMATSEAMADNDRTQADAN